MNINKEIIIECKGGNFMDYHIPKFTLTNNEIVELKIMDNNLDSLNLILGLFTGKFETNFISICSNLIESKIERQSKLFRILKPWKVSTYLKKFTEYQTIGKITEIYTDERLTNDFNVKALAGNPKKTLELYSITKKNRGVIFNFFGLDPSGVIINLNVIRHLINERKLFGIYVSSNLDEKPLFKKCIEIKNILES